MLNFDIIKGFLILGLIFIPLERMFSFHRQKVFRKGWRLDLFYFFTGSFLSKLGLFLSAGIVILITDFFSNKFLISTISEQNFILQFLEAVLIAEIGYYFAHRLFHTVPFLWEFHEIHHSVKELDWLTTVRVHPVEQIGTKLFQMIPLYWLGFSNQVLATFFLFSAGMAFFIHSNIKVKIPFLKYVIVTPEYHHWHHEISKTYYNYSAQLPLIDWLFGTFYLPKNKHSKVYCVNKLIPLNYWQQLIYPFQQLTNNFKSPNNLINQSKYSPKSRSKNKILTLTLRRFKKMINKLNKLPLPLIIFMFISISIFSAGVVIPLTTHMTIPTFLSSLNAGNITAQELKELQTNNPDSFILIDVRTPEEYREGHIEGSILIPLSDIEAGFGVKQIHQLFSDKPNPKVVLYCHSGVRSIKAYSILEKNGINAINLQGGIKAWNKSKKIYSN